MASFLQKKQKTKIFLWLLFAWAAFSFSGTDKNFAAAAERQYQYDEILTNIRVNVDTTFDVEERQTFDYQGLYNQGWRTIPFKKFDAITDIQVIDGETGRPLTYSPTELNKVDSSSWGKFTYNRKNGAENIIWYYNVLDDKHTWILKYKIHGGIGFFKEYDELYWNVMTDYAVPVRKAETHVYLPREMASSDGMYINYYADPPSIVGQPDEYSISDKKTFDYSSQSLRPRTKLTILAQWPKGIVDQKQYWRDFLKIYWVYLTSFFLVLLGLISGFLYWYISEKHKKGRGTVVAQYDPPKNLRPAVAEVLCKERVTRKTWPATIVDLAVRGYVRIKEKKTGLAKQVLRVFGFVFSFAMLVFALFILFQVFSDIKNVFSDLDSFFGSFFIAFFVLYFLFLGFQIAKENIDPKDYEIEKAKDFSNDPDLEEYERQFLSALFEGGDSFSTDTTDRERKQALYEKMQKVKKELLEDAELDTQAYERGLSVEQKRNTVMLIAFGVFVFLFISNKVIEKQTAFLLASVVFLIFEFFYFKYEARLSKEGNILKEDWLGFKLYLETAEKYRMQNLTPDLFEKYLPYAIIFGVEEKWAKNFDSLNMAPPEWYAGSSVGYSGFSGSGPSSFSASSFASSFSASFASSFASSGAGGAGGGGGGAGGGGGGGGGGAS
jgi:hypothetical protein